MTREYPKKYCLLPIICYCYYLPLYFHGTHTFCSQTWMQSTQLQSNQLQSILSTIKTQLKIQLQSKLIAIASELDRF